MTKHLSIDRMLEAAFDSEMPGLANFVEYAESLATMLAKNLAMHLDIETQDAVWQGAAFGGLCARFGPTPPSQACPAVIDDMDKEGDWELLSTPAMGKAALRPSGLSLPSDTL
jgi:hypothetical protein